jgi:hypothetical protein
MELNIEYKIVIWNGIKYKCTILIASYFKDFQV